MIFLPTLGMLTLTYLVGFQALFAGITLLVLAWRLRVRYVDAARGDKSSETAAAAPPEAEAQRG